MHAIILCVCVRAQELQTSTCSSRCPNCFLFFCSFCAAKVSNTTFSYLIHTRAHSMDFICMQYFLNDTENDVNLFEQWRDSPNFKNAEKTHTSQPTHTNTHNHWHTYEWYIIIEWTCEWNRHTCTHNNILPSHARLITNTTHPTNTLTTHNTPVTNITTFPQKYHHHQHNNK